MAKISEKTKLLLYICDTKVTTNLKHNMKFSYVSTIMVVARRLSSLDPGLLQN